jgi:hypothetical protein
VYNLGITRKVKTMVYVCVFCENLYSSEAVICSECNDYKGMLPLEVAKEEYDFIKENFSDI